MTSSTKKSEKIQEKIPLLVIVGPTASGKSDLAVRLAKNTAGKVIGEIISADSRQVYVGMDIGTGKITHDEMQGVPHHLLDIADPHDRFTTMDWKKCAEAAIADIHSRGKLPIICGGTGFYISTLIDGLGFPDVPADPVEQAQLEAQTPEILFEELKKLDPVRAATIDLKNKRRLARAIVIARALGSVPAITRGSAENDSYNGSDKENNNTSPKYDLVMIGVNLPDSELRSRIHARLVSRIDAGMLREVERLHAPKTVIDPVTGASVQTPGLSYERLEELGLEYRYVALYLQNKTTLSEMTAALSIKIWHYARRQKTWWRKDTRITWLSPQDILKKFSQ